jgi:hypothetical protein
VSVAATRAEARSWWRSPSLALFLIVFSAYAYFYQAGGWNQNSRFDLVRAGVESRSSSIDAYHRNTGDKACRGPQGRCVKAGPGDHYYCDKAPGASWLAMPMYALVYGIAGSEKPSPGFLAFAAYLSSVSAVALPSALAVVALFWLFCLMGLRRGASVGMALGYGLATLAFPYATLFYGHQLTAALLLLGFVALVRERKGATTMSPAQLFGVGCLLGLSVVVEYPSAVPLMAIGVYALSFLRPWQRLVWLGLGIAIPGLLCAAYHWSVFGGPATLPYEFSTQPHRSQGFFMGLGVPDFQVLGELLLGSYRGLLYGSPWLVVALPGAFFLFRRPGYRAEAGISIFVIVFLLWLNSSLVDWQGGWAMGPRYLIPAIPFLVILGAGLFRPEGRPRLQKVAGALVLALGLYSGRMMVMGAAVKPEVPTHIKKPFGDYLGPRFAKGQLAVSTQGIDMPNAPRNAEPKAWNLGQRVFGISGRASLLPLLLLQLALLGWMWRDRAMWPDNSD